MIEMVARRTSLVIHIITHTIQFIDGDVYLNDKQVLKSYIKSITNGSCGSKSIKVRSFEEKLPNGKKYLASYLENY